MEQEGARLAGHRQDAGGTGELKGSEGWNEDESGCCWMG
jgi:hypothetical protein